MQIVNDLCETIYKFGIVKTGMWCAFRWRCSLVYGTKLNMGGFQKVFELSPCVYALTFSLLGAADVPHINGSS